MRSIITAIIIIGYFPSWAQPVLTTVSDSSNANHLLFITKDQSQNKMFIAIKQTATGKTDTVYDNLNLPNLPGRLIFVKILEDKYCVMLVESMFAFSYRYYEWKAGKWNFQTGHVLAWKDSCSCVATTVEVIDYTNIKLGNEAGEYLYKVDLENKTVGKEKIETDQN